MKNIHIVIKKDDALKYLPEPALQSLEQILNIIANGKKATNDYYVCNIDEPYAEMVHGVIVAGEYAKSQSS